MKSNLIDVLFKSKLRAQLLGVMALSPDKKFYVNQLARLLDSNEGNVHRQLVDLNESGLLLREEDGNRVYFQINRDASIFSELRDLLLKTVALKDVVLQALEPLSDKIDLAFIYGSEAKGEAAFTSDIDLIVVGQVDDLKLHEQIAKAEETLNRAISYSLYREKEFDAKKRKDGFLKKISSEKIILLLGQLDDVR